MLGAESIGQHPPTLIIADDHALVVDSLRSRLTPTYEVVAVAADGDELLRVLRHKKAMCILLDLEMPGRHGLEIIPLIRRAAPSSRILVVTMFEDRVIADAALSAGAHGFVPKSAPVRELDVAIGEVLAGRTYCSARVARPGHRLGLGAEHLGLHRLTPRQQQIILLLGDGKSGKEISDVLHLSPSTVTFHRRNTMRVLGLRSESGLLRYAILVRAAIVTAPSA